LTPVLALGPGGTEHLVRDVGIWRAVPRELLRKCNQITQPRCNSQVQCLKQRFWFESRMVVLTPPMTMERAECSETSAHKIQTPGIHPKERIQHSEQGESLKSKLNSFNIPNNLRT